MNHRVIPLAIEENVSQMHSIKGPLTPEKLRALTGLDINDEEATEIIHSIRLFCKVLYQFAVSKNIAYIQSEATENITDNIQNKAA